MRDGRKMSPDNVEGNIWLDNRVAEGQYADFQLKDVETVVVMDSQVFWVVHCMELPSRQILDPIKSTRSLFTSKLPVHGSLVQ